MNLSPQPPTRPAWRLPLALVVVLALVLALRSVDFRAAVNPPSPTDPTGPIDSPSQTVTLTREGPAPADASVTVAWREGQTVLDATRRADERAPDDWSSRWRGDGPMAFLEELGGVPNQGADGLNWQFEVNGAYATQGAGATPLGAGDRVLWKLAPYE